jgi:hypothetical protein
MPPRDTYNVDVQIEQIALGKEHSFSLFSHDFSKEQAASLADAIRKNGRMAVVSLECDGRDAELIRPILNALQEQTSLRELALHGGRPVADACLTELCATVRNHPHIAKFYTGGTGLTEAGSQRLCEAFASNTALTHFDINGNAIGDAGAMAVAEMRASRPQLQHLTLNNCNIGDAGAMALCQTTNADKDTLLQLNLQGNPITPQGADAIAHYLEHSGVRNLYHAPLPEHERIDQFAKRNMEGVSRASRILDNIGYHEHYDILKHTSPTDMGLLWRHVPYLANTGRKDHHAMLDDFLTLDLPSLPKTADWESLTTRNKKGYCALDNPTTWQKAPDWLPKLAESQAALDSLLTETNVHGHSYLSIGLAFAAHKVIPALNTAGVQLQQAQLFDAEGKASDILTNLTELDNARHLFTAANWQGEDKSAMHATYRALPPMAKAQVQNAQSLAIELDRQQLATIGKGR